MHKRKKKEGVYRDKRSKYWSASFTDESGTRVRRSTGTTDKRAAVRLRGKWEAEAWDKRVRGVEPDRSFEQVVVLYLNDTQDVKRSTATDRMRAKALAGYFPEGTLMNDLSSVDVLGYVEYRQRDGIANKTINKELSLLSSAIKWVTQKYDWVLPNPVVGKRLPEINDEARCLTVEEFRKLLAAAKDSPHQNTRNYLPEFCILGFNTMMRPGEMLGLEWDRVDFGERVVRLDAVHTKGKERRLVPLNDDAHAALVRLRRVCDRNCPDTPWVFASTKPRSIGARIKSVSKVFASAVQRAGIPHATPHCLRHTSITEGVHAPNANVVDVSKVAGHKNLRTTMGYIHIADERLHQVVANLPSVKR